MTQRQAWCGTISDRIYRVDHSWLDVEAKLLQRAIDKDGIQVDGQVEHGHSFLATLQRRLGKTRRMISGGTYVENVATEVPTMEHVYYCPGDGCERPDRK